MDSGKTYMIISGKLCKVPVAHAKKLEKRVLEAVKPVLTDDEACSFFANTLFIDCGLATLAKVILALDKIGAGKIKVSDVHGEFAIDFI